MAKPKQGTTLQATDTQPVEQRKPGRPTVMTEAVQLEICARLGEGETLRAVCRDKDMPSTSTVMRALHGGKPAFSDFRQRYAVARESLMDHWAEEILEISDDGTTDYVLKTGRNGHEYMAVDQEHIQRSRLRVDSRRWLLSKLRPEQYGDKLTTESSSLVLVKHDVASLSEREKMRRFALFMVEDSRQPAIEGELAAPDGGTKSQKLAGHIMNAPQATEKVENDDDAA
jgi:hypothetical protein